jgi:tRNA pseudouridine55 synthase
LSTPFGFINAFKPPGPSSAAYGNWVRQLAGGVPVGHWGTLDPLACGVLLLGVGKAARLFPLVGDTRKSYVFELVVGEQTDSGDSSGAIIARATVPRDWKERLTPAASSLIGPQQQVPPMHSAVKVGGQPLYRSARAGTNIPRAPRAVAIYSLNVLPDAVDSNRARLFVECDAGTYVRVLCEELGRMLGLPARMGALLRVAAGPFRLDQSVTPTRLASTFQSCLIDPLDVLPHPRIDLDAACARRFVFGSEINVAGNSGSPASVLSNHPCEGTVLVTHDRALLGIGEVYVRDATTILAPTRVFAAP